MNREQILSELQGIFRQVFDDAALVVTPSLSTNDVDTWDSLTHLELIHETEEHFKIKFSFDEVMLFNSAGDMVQQIAAHLQLTEK
jgi:acyl carrier protein